jgi:hypothetical protein
VPKIESRYNFLVTLRTFEIGHWLFQILILAGRAALLLWISKSLVGKIYVERRKAEGSRVVGAGAPPGRFRRSGGGDVGFYADPCVGFSAPAVLNLALRVLILVPGTQYPVLERENPIEN